MVHRPSAPIEFSLETSFSPENYRNFEFNGKLYSSVWPEKIDLLSEREQDELKNAAWFQAGLPRRVSLEILLQQPPGSFLVRHSESHKKSFALSMRAAPSDPPKLSHYLIEKSPRGYKIKGFDKEFSTLGSLITHHSVIKERLSTPLILPSRGMSFHDPIVNDPTESESESVESPQKTMCCLGKMK